MKDIHRARVPASTKFTRVKNLDTEKEGTVEDRLSQQFTVQYDDNTFGFLFYKDKGVTWTPLDEMKKVTGTGMTFTTGGSFAEFAQKFDDAIMMDILKAYPHKKGI